MASRFSAPAIQLLATAEPTSRVRLGEALDRPFRPRSLTGRPAQAALTAIVLSGFISLVLYAVRPEEVGPSTLLFVWTGFAICLLPGVAWISGPRATVPIFEAICVAYALQDIAPALLLPNHLHTIFGEAGFSERDLNSALLIELVGMLGMLASYWWVRYGSLGRRLPNINIPLSESRLRFYLPLAVVVGAVLMIGTVEGFGPPGESGLAAIFRVLANQLAVAVALLAYRVLDRTRARKAVTETLLLGTSVAWAILVGLATTMVESVLTIPVILATVGIQQRRRAAWGLLAVAALAYLLVLQPVKSAVRSLPTGVSEGSSLITQANVWTEFATAQVDRLLSGHSADDAITSSRTSSQRLDFLHLFVQVRSETPSVIPFYEGYSYTYFLTGWIPRFLWPDKPNAQRENRELVLAYGITTSDVLQTTTMAIGTVAEAYANFGDVGVLAFMLIQGAILGAACRVFARGGGIGGQAVLLSVLVFFLNGINTHTSTLYGGLAQNLAANAVVLWLLAGDQAARAQESTTARHGHASSS